MKIIITLLALFSINVAAYADNLCAISKQNAVALNPVASCNAMNLQNKYDTKFHHLNLNLARNSRSVSGNVMDVLTSTIALSHDRQLLEQTLGIQQFFPSTCISISVLFSVYSF
jgi:hypothetical protein